MRKIVAYAFSLFLFAIVAGTASYFVVGSCRWLLVVSEAAARESSTKVDDDFTDVTRLENGMTVIFKPLTGADRIAVESIYDVGFVDEPKGMCQATHLLEHLVCNSATESYGPGESMERLNKIGMANAETLPDWTHYDYSIPGDQLELALKIEAERLTSLRIDQAVVSREIPRVYQETDFVEKNAQSGMLKHAFMAFSQAWRNGETKALVRGGLEGIPVDRLAEFHSAVYRTDRLTLVIVGNFDVEIAKQTVRQTVGKIECSTSQKDRRGIDWEKIPASMTVEWDASLSAVCVYFPPPKAEFDRMVLSHLGTNWTNTLDSDRKLKNVADMVMSSLIQWPVGELPFFVYAAAKPGASLDHIEQELKRSVENLIATPAKKLLNQMQDTAKSLNTQRTIYSKANLKSTVNSLVSQQKMDRSLALDMVLGQSALNERMFRKLDSDAGDGGTARLKNLQAAELKAILERVMKPENQRVIRLVPQKHKS